MNKYLLLGVILLISGWLFGQRTISGVVTDASGETLLGANVIAKESSSLGTITDIDGRFTLDLTPEVTALIFSYIGYETIEVKLTSSDILDVIMVAGNLIDEVVVSTFGTSTRERFTGSAATISSERIGLRPITNVGQALLVLQQGCNPPLEVVNLEVPPISEFEVLVLFPLPTAHFML